jgi:MerR family transcriptional regulator, light-induced transcriptional regulator
MDTRPDTSARTAGISPPADANLLTLQEAADRLKVHYMTAYRWVRRGDLVAFKAGGRLRIRAADLDAFVTGRKVDAALPRQGQRTDWPTHLQRLHAHLRAGEGIEANAMVRKIVADGAPAADVYTRLLTPAMHLVGEDWAAGRLRVAEEHRATEIVSTIMKRHGAAFRRRGPRRGVAVTVTPPGEAHALAAAMVADFLRMGGYDVDHLGADVPLDDLADFLEAFPADVVCVSVTTPGLPGSVYDGIVGAARRARADARVVFGGQGADRDAIDAAGGILVERLELLDGQLAQYVTA